MEIEYRDAEARAAATPPGERPMGWTNGEISRLRLVVQCVRAGRVPSDVLSLRSLRLRPDPEEGGRVLTSLSPDRALALAFKTDSFPAIAMLGIVPTRTDTGR
jgi:hypothetical protein